MKNMAENNIKQIDFAIIIRSITNNYKIYIIVLPIIFILACFIILCVPRYYKCEVTLAPELSNTSSLGNISGLASSLGFDLSGGINSQDAISPTLYPDLMESTDFVVSLFPIRIKTKDGEKTFYYEYLKSKQKYAWWIKIIGKAKELFKEKDTVKYTGKEKINPFILSRTQQEISKMINGKISCNVDKKTDVISISVEDQDPMVCATIADSVRKKLQDFIIAYRTNKARNDLNQTKKLYLKAKEEYEKARQKYAMYSDANQDLVLESFVAKRTDLENEMQLRYNIYSNLVTQLQMAQAKIQERTPAFTVLKCATVPIKPAGPKRMLFVTIIMIFSFIIMTIYNYIKTK